MGAVRGRRPTPDHLKLVKGNPGKRKIPADRPKPALGRPVMPAWVAADPIARGKWEELLEDLTKPGANVLSKQDRHSLEMAAKCYANFRKAQDVIDEKGFTYTMETKSGDLIEVQRPEVSIAQKFEAAYRAYTDRYGLSPAMRTKVAVIDDGSEAENRVQGLLGGRRK